MAKAKITFGAIPARAFGDPRLKGLHLKVLGVVALHDRLSAARKNGQGCWAGNKRLAEMIGCNYSNLSTALTELATWGYIDRRTNPMNKTRRILFVVYDERDDAVMKSNRDENPLPAGKQSAADDSLPVGEDDAETVCPDFENGNENQPLGGGEYIPLKRGIDSAEAEGIDSAEAASSCDAAKSFAENEGLEPERIATDGNLLGKIQTLLKSLEGQELTETQIEELRDFETWCFKVDDEYGLDGVGPWAQRLGIEIGILLDEPEESEPEPA